MDGLDNYHPTLSTPLPASTWNAWCFASPNGSVARPVTVGAEECVQWIEPLVKYS